MYKKTELIAPFSAISSWDGYEYQGHLAIYYTLSVILEKLNNNESLDDYILQIEGEEDFSIKKDKKYISLHQVKAGTVSLSTRDIFCYVIGVLQKDDCFGYFHINKNETITKNFVEETISHIDILLNEINVKSVIRESELEKHKKENSEKLYKDDNYIVLEKIKDNKKKGSLYNILYYKNKNYNCVDEVEKSLDIIKESLIAYKKLLKNKTDDQVYSIYDEKFDNSIKIRKGAYKKIKEILDLEREDYKIFADEDYLKFVYGNVFLILQDRVNQNKIDGPKDEKCEISFTEIYEAVVKSYQEEMYTDEYQYYVVLQEIIDNFSRYKKLTRYICQKCNKTSKCDLCTNKDICNLYKQIEIIRRANAEEKEKIISNLLLNKPGGDRPNNLPDKHLITDLFLDSLIEIKTINLDKNYIFASMKDNQFYRLSLDKCRYVEDFLVDVKVEEPYIRLMYEVDVLITDRLVEKKVNYYDGKFTHIGGNVEDRALKEEFDERSENNITKPKNIRLIDKEIAVKELG